tara:strand:- start:317 stop:769 length:453 start_codon:yes stop_codon:yes gene_type:complete
MNNDRKTLIRLAATLPKGSEERRTLLASLQKEASWRYFSMRLQEWLELFGRMREKAPGMTTRGPGKRDGLPWKSLMIGGNELLKMLPENEEAMVRRLGQRRAAKILKLIEVTMREAPRFAKLQEELSRSWDALPPFKEIHQLFLAVESKR